MAKPTQVLLSGTLENLIFYQFRGKACVRRRPEKVRQTKATKASAGLFGKAVSMSAALRQGLVTVLPAKDRYKCMYLLNTTLAGWLREKRPKTKGPSNALSALHGLAFNEKRALSACLQKGITVDWSKAGRAIIRFPALVPAKDIKAPAKTSSLTWKIAVAGCSVDSSSVSTQQAVASLEMNYNHEPFAGQSIELPFSLGRGDLAVVVISLQYRVAKNGYSAVATDSRWMPVDIVDAAYF